MTTGVATYNNEHFQIGQNHVKQGKEITSQSVGYKQSIISSKTTNNYQSKNATDNNPKNGTSVSSVNSNYKLFSGSLPSYTDIAQGHTGDCYFLSALAMLTENNPDYVKSLIHKEEDGSYTVRLYYPTNYKASNYKVNGEFYADAAKANFLIPNANWTAVNINIDLESSDLTDNVGVNVKSNKTIWPAIIEKAYMELLGNNNLIDGGSSGWAISFLTGQPNIYIPEKEISKHNDNLSEALLNSYSKDSDGKYSYTVEFGHKVDDKTTESHEVYVPETYNKDKLFYNPWGGVIDFNEAKDITHANKDEQVIVNFFDQKKLQNLKPVKWK